MCYVHNQWYDISCATLYVCMYMSSSNAASAVYNLISELYNIIILRLKHYDLHHYLLPNIQVMLSLSHTLNFKICGAGCNQLTHKAAVTMSLSFSSYSEDQWII